MIRLQLNLPETGTPLRAQDVRVVNIDELANKTTRGVNDNIDPTAPPNPQLPPKLPPSLRSQGSQTHNVAQMNPLTKELSTTSTQTMREMADAATSAKPTVSTGSTQTDAEPMTGGKLALMAVDAPLPQIVNHYHNYHTTNQYLQQHHNQLLQTNQYATLNTYHQVMQDNRSHQGVLLRPPIEGQLGELPASRKRKGQYPDERRVRFAGTDVLIQGRRNIRGRNAPAYTVVEPDDILGDTLSWRDRLGAIENGSSSNAVVVASKAVTTKKDRKGKADEEVSKRLHDLYYSEKFFAGSDRLWAVYREKYKDKPISQRAVLDWLKHQSLHQTYTRPMKRGIITPIIASKKGSMSLDCVKMESFNGYDTCYNMVDIFSKRFYSMPMKGQTAANTIKFFQEVLDKFPNIKISAITVDNGGEFQEPFKTLAQKQSSTLIYTKPHSPWSNNVERYNRTFKTMLNMAMKADNTKDWVGLVPTVTSNMNQVRSFATGETPLAVDQSTDKHFHKKVSTIIQNRAAKKYGVKAQRGNDIAVGDLVRKVYDYDAAKIQRASKRGYFASTVYRVTSVLPSNYPNAMPAYKLVEKDTGKVLSGTWARWQLLKVPADTVLVEEPEEIRPGSGAGTK
ncbi:hypothetical protein HDV00_010792 [Rhizophlyctis rosea]|nr:hypothetical protein HDV00_010792 [Rhizophlyctis rosea]